MVQKSVSSYITGLTNMASYCSKEIGPSYIEADCFDLEDYKEGFSKYYKVSTDDFEIKETDKSLKDILSSWLGNKDMELVDGIIHWISVHIGDPSLVYSVKGKNNFLDSLSVYNGGASRFYFIEDIYFVEFKDYMVCFILGNDE